MSVARCPTCGAPAVQEHGAFCSKRCADIDLHRWLSESYAIPAEDDQGPEDNDEES